MTPAHIHLIRYALELGHTVSVDDGEEWVVKRSTDMQDILAAVNSVDMSTLLIRDADGKELGRAAVCDQGEPDETIWDNTITPFMETWDDVYMALNY